MVKYHVHLKDSSNQYIGFPAFCSKWTINNYPFSTSYLKDRHWLNCSFMEKLFLEIDFSNKIGLLLECEIVFLGGRGVKPFQSCWPVKHLIRKIWGKVNFLWKKKQSAFIFPQRGVPPAVGPMLLFVFWLLCSVQFKDEVSCFRRIFLHDFFPQDIFMLMEW